MYKFISLEFKIIPSTKTQLNKLLNMFDEANNLWKNIIENSLIDESLTKNFNTPHLGSQLKQDLIFEFRNLLKSQKELKKNNKSGKIKYHYKRTISVFSSQPIKIKGHRARIQKLGTFYVRGEKNFKYLEKLKIQNIIKEWKPVAFQILKKATGFYIKMIVKLIDYDQSKIVKYNKPISIDFGINPSFTFSNGLQIDKIYVSETKLLKKQQQRLSKEKDETKRKRLKWLLNIQYEKILNRKREIINKIIAFLKKFDTVVIQNELIINWKEQWFGKEVQYSILGKVKERIKRDLNSIVIDSSIPTTKTCSNCGSIKPKNNLSEKIYNCNECNFSIDRDLNSTYNILQFTDFPKPKYPITETISCFLIKQKQII